MTFALDLLLVHSQFFNTRNQKFVSRVSHLREPSKISKAHIMQDACNGLFASNSSKFLQKCIDATFSSQSAILHTNFGSQESSTATNCGSGRVQEGISLGNISGKNHCRLAVLILVFGLCRICAKPGTDFACNLESCLLAQKPEQQVVLQWFGG